METWKKESHYDSNGTGYNIDMNREPKTHFYYIWTKDASLSTPIEAWNQSWKMNRNVIILFITTRKEI